MPVTLPLYGGRLKRDIIEMAFEYCGIAGFEFEHTPEEVASCLRLLDTMMAEWPWNLMGYNASAYGAGLPEEESGLAEIDVPAVFMHLALRRSPGLGKALSPSANATIASAYNSACARHATMISQPLGRSVPVGMGTSRLIPIITETGDEDEE